MAIDTSDNVVYNVWMIGKEKARRALLVEGSLVFAVCSAIGYFVSGAELVANGSGLNDILLPLIGGVGGVLVYMHTPRGDRLVSIGIKGK